MIPDGRPVRAGHEAGVAELPPGTPLRPPSPERSGERAWVAANASAVAAARRRLDGWIRTDGGQPWPVDRLAAGWRGAPVVLDVAGLVDHVDPAPLLDHVLRRADLDRGRLEFAQGSPDHLVLDERQYLQRGRNEPRSVASDVLVGLLEGGATAVLNGVVHHSEPLEQVVECFEVLFGVRIGVNAYLSLPGARGFGPHWDDHDVLIMQVSGAKRWIVEAPEPEVPLRGYTPERTSGRDVLEVDLRAGTGLWVPRGFGHRTESGPGLSSHLTIYVRSLYGTDLVEPLLRSTVDRGGPPLDEDELARAWADAVDARAVAGLVASHRARLAPRRRGSFGALCELLQGRRDGLRISSSNPGLLWVADGDEPAVAMAGRLVGCDPATDELLGALGPVGTLPAADVGDVWPQLEALLGSELLFVERDR